MPLTMRFKILDLGLVIGGSAENPRATAEVYVENIDATYNNADIQLKTIDYLILSGLESVNFPVPNPNATTPYVQTLLFLKSVTPKFKSDNKAEVAVEWGLITATALDKPDGSGGTKKPSDTATNEVLGPEYTVDTAGGTRHITQSVYTRSAIKVGGTGNFSAVDMKRAIGVDGDSVKGCDIYTGDIKWSVKVKGIPVTAEYIDKVTEMTGTTNLLPFYGRDIEELLFLGAQFNFKSGSGWEGTYNFHQKKTQTNVSIATGLVIPEVRGHDFVWVTYPKAVLTDSAGKKQLGVTPNAVYCEQVYERKDFKARLGI